MAQIGHPTCTDECPLSGGEADITLTRQQEPRESDFVFDLPLDFCMPPQELIGLRTL